MSKSSLPLILDLKERISKATLAFQALLGFARR